MNNNTIFTRFDFVRRGMLAKQDPDAENITLITKFKKLNAIYDGFLTDNISIGSTSIAINGVTKFNCVPKEVERKKKNYSFSTVVAVSKNNAIGENDGDLPWGKQSADMKRFRELTTGNVLVVGRKTFTTFGNKPLKNRLHIILTNDFNFTVEEQYKDQCIIVHSVQKVLEKLDELAEERSTEENPMKVFCIGGGQIYQQFMPYIDNIFLTKIMVESIDADTFFPPIDQKEFVFSHNEKFEIDENNQSEYHFRFYERIQKKDRKEISSGIVKQVLLSYYLENL